MKSDLVIALLASAAQAQQELQMANYLERFSRYEGDLAHESAYHHAGSRFDHTQAHESPARTNETP